MIPNDKLQEQLDKLASGNYGKVMRQYLKQVINEMDTARGARDAGIEQFVGRELAIEYLEKIVRRLTPDEEVDDVLNEYE